VVNDEMDSVLSNNTWVMNDLLLGSKPMDCKWIFRRKYSTGEALLNFKVKLDTFKGRYLIIVSLQG
jgi:hypothetical protein